MTGEFLLRIHVYQNICVQMEECVVRQQSRKRASALSKRDATESKPHSLTKEAL